MAIVREIEGELHVRNRNLIRQFFANSEGAFGEDG